MRKPYYFYLLKLSLSLFIFGWVFGFLILLSALSEGEIKNLAILIEFLGGTISIGIVVFLIFIPPLIISSIIKWALCKYMMLSLLLNFLVFCIYYFTMFVLDKYSGTINDNGLVTYIWMGVCTSIVLIINEYLIFKANTI